MLSVLPAAQFIAIPDSQSVTAASIFASTTFLTNVKSLDCSPSPYITGCSLLLIALMNLGITAEYCDEGSCLGPNTLKYLKEIVFKPYILENTLQYFSPDSFDTAYGDNGFANHCFKFRKLRIITIYRR